MAILKENTTTATVVGKTDKVDLSIKQEDVQHIINLLSTNLYSNPIPSIVREITSNGVDATVDAGNSNPVVVGLYERNNSYYFYVKDFGTGISEEKFNELFTFFGASDKRESNDFIGSFGIGRLSPISYADSYTIESIYNGIKYTYEIIKNGLQIEFHTIFKEKTNENNGTTVIIPIYHQDIDNFVEAIVEQILFFPNVTIAVDKYIAEYSNKAKELQSLKVYTKNFKHFKVLKKEYAYSSYNFRSIKQQNPKIVLLLGDVCYPIKEANIHINDFYKKINFNQDLVLGIKFPIGAIPITPNREEIIYTQDTINTINDAIILADKELSEHADKSFKKEYDVEEFIAFADEFQNFKSTISIDKKNNIYFSVFYKDFTDLDVQFKITSENTDIILNSKDTSNLILTLKSWINAYNYSKQLKMFNITYDRIYKANAHYNVTKMFISRRSDSYSILYTDSMSELNNDTKKWLRENYNDRCIYSKSSVDILVKSLKSFLHFSKLHLLPLNVIEYFYQIIKKLLFDENNFQQITNSSVPKEIKEQYKEERKQSRKNSVKKTGLLGYPVIKKSYSNSVKIDSESKILDNIKEYIVINKANTSFFSKLENLFLYLITSTSINGRIFAVSNTTYKNILLNKNDSILTVRDLFFSKNKLAVSIRDLLYLAKNYSSQIDYLKTRPVPNKIDVKTYEFVERLIGVIDLNSLSSYSLLTRLLNYHVYDIDEVLSKLFGEEDYELKPSKELQEILDDYEYLIKFAESRMTSEIVLNHETRLTTRILANIANVLLEDNELDKFINDLKLLKQNEINSNNNNSKSV